MKAKVFGGAALLLSLVSTILLSGCVRQPPPPPMRFSKAGATEQQFIQERYACIQQAQQPRSAGYVDQYGGVSRGTIVTSRGVYLSCMSAKGYSWGPEGDFAAPPGTGVQLSE